MSQFNLGKKIFFLFPPIDFSRNILQKLFEEGFEIYKLNSTDKIIPLLQEYHDSVLFINSDYPYEGFDFQNFYEQTLNQDLFKELLVYSFFSESVTYGTKIKDYISLEQTEEELLQILRKILEEGKAHGKREHVRFGSYAEIISSFTFECEGTLYTADLHDISPTALSLSIEEDLEPLLDHPLRSIKLTVGAYEIHVSGMLAQKRNIGGKELYIAVFDGEEYKAELFNFIYTSLEKKMDEFMQSLGS